jgi:hypothetical protein
MATHKDVRNEKQSRHLHAAQTTLFFGLTLAVLVALVFTGLNLSSPVLLPDTGMANSRAEEAWAARYQGQAAAFALQETARTRSNLAYTARLQGLADEEVVEQKVQVNTAYTQRMQGLADFYALMEAERFQRANDAYSSRLQGLADWYAREK